MTKFSDLSLAEPILRAVEHEGYTIPTPIQAQAIPHILTGRDVLGCAQTGTGKTAAFSLPILHRLSASVEHGHHPHPNQHKIRPVRAVVLSPTRELALQIDESMRTYGKHTHLRTVCVFGGVSQSAQTRALRAGVDIIVATPGRLMDLMQQGYVDLTRVEVFVLDEADRMLDMGFIDPIRRSNKEQPRQRQKLMFSATMPDEIQKLANNILVNPMSVQVAAVASTPDLVEQSVYYVSKREKPDLLAGFLSTKKVERALVFTRTKHGADRVVRDLIRVGIPADAIHGNKRQNVRQRTLGDFRSGKTWVLVATDIAARGIDVDGISHVINYDLPNEPETYVHRIGRTARAGASGEAVMFCDRGSEERDYLRLIERLIRKPIRVRDDDPTVDMPRRDPSAHREEPEPEIHVRPHRAPRAPSHSGGSGYSGGSGGTGGGGGGGGGYPHASRPSRGSREGSHPASSGPPRSKPAYPKSGYPKSEGQNGDAPRPYNKPQGQRDGQRDGQRSEYPQSQNGSGSSQSQSRPHAPRPHGSGTKKPFGAPSQGGGAGGGYGGGHRGQSGGGKPGGFKKNFRGERPSR